MTQFATPQSCDTFVVLGDVSAKGLVVFGKNSDRPRGEVQEVIARPAAAHAAGAKLRCTYIEIDQVAATQPVVLSKPGWMWGAEMGANAAGVAIGNEAVWSSYEPEPLLDKRLLGMDLVRLGLERADTARAAVDVITALLERHGQGGPCSADDQDFAYYNSFLIADPSEAWVLETAGRLWAAERVTAGHRNISNCYTIGAQFHLSSDGLVDKATAAGLWTGSGAFNFAQAFSGEKKPGEPRLAAGRKLVQDLIAGGGGGKFDAAAMMAVLRDEPSGICRPCDTAFPTQGSQVSTLSKVRPCCHWLTGTPDPKRSVFKPFIFTSGVTAVSARIACPDGDNDRRHALYKAHEEKYDLLRDEHGGKQLRELMMDVESSCVSEVEDALDTFDGSDDSNLELAALFDDSVDAEMRFYK